MLRRMKKLKEAKPNGPLYLVRRTAFDKNPTLPEKSPYSELFYSVFSRIRTEYGEILVFSRNTGKYGSE